MDIRKALIEPGVGCMVGQYEFVKIISHLDVGTLWFGLGSHVTFGGGCIHSHVESMGA